MNSNQTLQEKISEQDPDFVSRVQGIEKSTELYAMKKKEICPDRREIIQARMDLIYRKSIS